MPTRDDNISVKRITRSIISGWVISAILLIGWFTLIFFRQSDAKSFVILTLLLSFYVLLISLASWSAYQSPQRLLKLKIATLTFALLPLSSAIVPLIIFILGVVALFAIHKLKINGYTKEEIGEMVYSAMHANKTHEYTPDKDEVKLVNLLTKLDEEHNLDELERAELKTLMKRYKRRYAIPAKYKEYIK